MGKKRVQEALQALREGFQEAGTPITEATVEFVTKALKNPQFRQLLIEQPKQLPVASFVAAILFDAGKDNRPEDQWTQDLQKMKKEWPYMLRSGLQSEAKDHFKGLPKKPGSGRHRLLKTPTERKRACDLVSKYVREGDSFRKAYEKVGAEINCSARTIQRVWRQRSKLSQAAVTRKKS